MKDEENNCGRRPQVWLILPPSSFILPPLVDQFLATLHTLNVRSSKSSVVVPSRHSISRSPESLHVAAFCPALSGGLPDLGRLPAGSRRFARREQGRPVSRRTSRRRVGRAGRRQRESAGDRGWWRPDGSPLPIAPAAGGGSETAALGNSIVRAIRRDDGDGRKDPDARDRGRKGRRSSGMRNHAKPS